MIETAGWVVRGLYSTATLLAAGSALLCCFTVSSDSVSTIGLRKMCARMAVLGLVLPCVWIATLAAELGGDWSSTLDPYYYQLIWSSTAAELILWRSIALFGLLIWSSIAAHTWVGVLSAIVAALSFSRYGHSLSDPTLVRSLLLTIHLSVIAWWFAVVPTLLWLYKHHPTKSQQIGERFGAQARVSVAITLLCGIALSGLQLISMQWSLQNSYIQALLIKLALVTTILCIAAFNYTRAFRLNHSSRSPTESIIVAVLRLDFALLISTTLSKPSYGAI